MTKKREEEPKAQPKSWRRKGGTQIEDANIWHRVKDEVEKERRCEMLKK